MNSHRICKLRTATKVHQNHDTATSNKKLRGDLAYYKNRIAYKFHVQTTLIRISVLAFSPPLAFCNH